MRLLVLMLLCALPLQAADCLDGKGSTSCAQQQAEYEKARDEFVSFIKARKGTRQELMVIVAEMAAKATNSRDRAQAYIWLGNLKKKLGDAQGAVTAYSTAKVLVTAAMKVTKTATVKEGEVIK